MAARKFQIIGRERPTAAPETAGPGASGAGKLFHAQPLKVIEVAATRDDGASELPVSIEETSAAGIHNLVEVELTDGLKLWMSVEEFARRFGQQAATRDAASPGVIVVPPALSLDESVSRGAGAIAIKLLKFFKIDPVGAAASMTAVAITEHIESKLGGPGAANPGLYRCEVAPAKAVAQPVARAGRLRALSEDQAFKADQPSLIFLHGTGSSTNGSFGDLWDPTRPEFAERLFTPYGGRVYGFEHRTLSESPLKNVHDLLSLLPERAKLHLVSHSRGGVVGELLCRALAKPGVEPFGPDDSALLSEGRYANDRALLGKINALARTKHIVVERFVRVACPALGTTLASERFDRYLSIMLNVIGQVPLLNAGSLYDVLSELLKAVIAKRTKPDEVPGIEAMMPQSGTMQLINASAEIDSPLAVIAGDAAGSGLLGKLKMLAVDSFFQQDNDLVVDTISMFGGAPRKTAHRLVDHGEAVNHFNYFRNKRSADGLANALAGRLSAADDFEPLATTQQLMSVRAVHVEPADSKRPIVFVLPGVMGSHLRNGPTRIWAAKLRIILWGQLPKIAFDEPDVHPDGPVEDYYGELIEHLWATHEVVEFAFDWRNSIWKTAEQLANEIAKKLNATDQSRPIRIIAHSMGGIVVRTMIQEHKQVWDELCKREGARFLMLGTPNGGSFVPIAALAGIENLIRTLALRYGVDTIAGLLRAFPGLLQMLPATSTVDYFEPDNWRKLLGCLALDRPGTPSADQRPAQDTLQAARRFRIEVLDRSPIDPQRMFYVAGQADDTIEDITFDDSRPVGDKVAIKVTGEGDGRVTWKTGIPAGLEHVWYANAVHGDLSNTADLFPAYVEILQAGSTSLLPREKPALARGSTTRSLERLAPPVLFPTYEGVLDAAIGGTRRRGARRSAAASAITVKVVHGDLRYAEQVVLVGHYAGDDIFHAERALDQQLDGRLSAKRALGLYPDRIGTTGVFLNPEEGFKRPRGAVVIGLGAFGELTPGKLTETCRRSLLELSAAYEELRRSNHGAGERIDRPLKVSSLFIGSGEGGLEPSDCAFAILRAVEAANSDIRSAKSDAPAINEIQFIELYEDNAHRFHRALDRVVKSQALAARIDLKPEVIEGVGGLRRVFSETFNGWWRRMQVTEASSGALNFRLLTDRARVEQSTQPTQSQLVDRLVHAAITTAADDERIGQTLFELLLPNELKRYAPDRQSLVLIVDARSARFPWELLRDRADQSRQPITVHTPMVRQLELEAYRARPTNVSEMNALVVGDTATTAPLAPLPGAQREAREVAEALNAGGFEVNGGGGAMIRPSATQVMSALYDRPYRVLHLAGHGVYGEIDKLELDGKPVKRMRGGMVLGEGIHLTPTEIEQMRDVPELVFINCCHLGSINQQSAPHELAANVATQFIKMGVRAVVAAGWAVNDDHAMEFAQVFYQRMLDQWAFGDAVADARRAIYGKGSNTWGAYQCYGDPHYKLIPRALTPSRKRNEQPFLSFREAALAAEQLAGQTRAATQKQLDRLRTEHLTALLGRIEKTWPDKSWRRSAELCATLALTCGSLDELAKAIEYSANAMQAEEANLPVRLIEQHHNYQVRHAVRRALDATGGNNAQKERVEAIKTIESSIKSLTEMIALIAETKERLCLVGGAYKRLALLVPAAKNRKKALTQMRDAYRRAHEKQSGHIDRYALNQWWSAELALGDGTLGSKDKTAASALMKQSLAQSEGPESFWTDVMRVDSQLIAAIVEGELDAQLDAITGGYLDAKKRGANPLEWRSAVEQIEFLARMIKEKPSKSLGKLQKQLADA